MLKSRKWLWPASGMPEPLARRQDNAAGPGGIEASVVVPPHQVAPSRSAGIVQLDQHDM
jgi:hypothetical protein